MISTLIDDRWIATTSRLGRDDFVQALNDGSLDPDASPHPLFDATWYRTTYGIRDHEVAIRHYLQQGWQAGLSPGPYFDSDFYFDEANIDNVVEPLGHFLEIGLQEAYLTVRPTMEIVSRMLDEPRASLALEALRRWCAARAMIDVEWYAWHHSLSSAGESESHYWAHGALTHERPNLYFDPSWYSSEHIDVRDSELLPFVHYAIHGWPLGYDPARTLNARRFRHFMGDDLPFERLARGDLTPGVVAPSYPRYAAQASDDSDATRLRPPQSLIGPSSPTDPAHLRIDWIVPDFGHGGGDLAARRARGWTPLSLRWRCHPKACRSLFLRAATERRRDPMGKNHKRTDKKNQPKLTTKEKKAKKAAKAAKKEGEERPAILT